MAKGGMKVCRGKERRVSAHALLAIVFDCRMIEALCNHSPKLQYISPDKGWKCSNFSPLMVFLVKLAVKLD